MSIPVSSAAEILRDAMRDTIRRNRFWYLVQAALMIAAGVFALLFPVFSSVALAIVLGWLLILSGAVQAIGLLGARHLPHFWIQALSVVLSLVIGFFILHHVGEGLVLLSLLLILFFLMEGIAKVVLALTIRPFPNWLWVLLSGIVGVVLAFLLWASLPATASWLLGISLGALLTCEGAALGYLAWHARKTA